MHKRSKEFRYYFEKFRALLLVFLIILCIVQVGILWSSQSGSFPFLSSFFADSKFTSQASLEEMKINYLLPYRIVLSNGYDNDHYIIPNGSNEYKVLWSGARDYLSKGLETRPTKTEAFSEELWGSIVANKPYYFEFKTQIPVDIIKWVLNIKKPAEGITEFNKLVISPEDPDNNYSDTLYLRDKNSIYTYVLSDFKGDTLGQNVSASIYNSLKSRPNPLNYKIAIETGRKSSLPKDMLAPLSTSSLEEYVNVTCVPFSGLQEGTSSLSDYDSIQKELFGEIRNDFLPDEDVYGSAVFKKSDGDSVYRLYKNSVIEYKYTGNQGVSEKSKLLEAYQKAVDYIMEMDARSNFMTGINVYLKSITEVNNSYIFKFDFSISQGGEHGEVPILLKDFKLPNSRQPLDSAITIEATSKRVLQCRWIALKLKVDKNYKEYQWNFPEFVDKTYSSYSQLAKGNLPLQNYGINYVIKSPMPANHTISPSFVLFNQDGSYDVPLEANN
ncbi:MAG: hypothetical protein K0R54_1696 [Clostridiaceae bacterium]|jgi:hypothetical protein|nr:hypothetical protein [Clostridiaceae bacterium]